MRWAVQVNLAISRNIMAKPTNHWIDCWNYLDFYAGPGVMGAAAADRSLIGEAGSPLIALEEARRFGIKYRAYLSDRDRMTAGLLAERVADDDRVVVQALACDEAVDWLIADRIPLKQGLAFFDPNGQLDWEAACRFARHRDFGRIDLLFNVNATLIKRMIASPVHRAYRPMEYLRAMGRASIYLWRPLGQWQFALALCSNFAFKEAEKRGFYLATSDRGRAIALRINYTDVELKERGQPLMPWGESHA